MGLSRFACPIVATLCVMHCLLEMGCASICFSWRVFEGYLVWSLALHSCEVFVGMGAFLCNVREWRCASNA